MKFTFGTTDTAVSDITAPSITVPVLNFPIDYRLKSDSPKEVILSNITSPLDQPESIRYGYSDIANIYANAGLNSDQVIGSKNGMSILTQLNTTLKITDDTGATVLGYLPISAHVVLKVPKSGYITEDILKSVTSRLIGTLYSDGKSNVMTLLRGAITPKGL